MIPLDEETQFSRNTPLSSDGCGRLLLWLGAIVTLALAGGALWLFFQAGSQS